MTINDTATDYLNPDFTQILEEARRKKFAAERSLKMIDKGTQTLVQKVRKDWYYLKGEKLGKRERRYRVVFEYLNPNGTKEAIKESFKLKADAELRLDKLKTEHEKKGVSFSSRALLFSEYAQAYKSTKLKSLRSGKTESSKVDLMIAFFKDRTIDSLRRDDIKRYKTHLESIISEQTKRKLTPRTVNTYLERLRALLSEAHADEKIISVPSFKGLIDTHLEKKRDLTITFGEFSKLVNACDVVKNGRDRKHLKIVLLGLHQLACRTEELQKIRVKDIDLENGIVKVWEGKRKVAAQREAYISKRLLAALIESGVMNQAEDERAFGNTSNYKRGFTTAKKIAGIREDFRLNDLRRTGITNMVQSGMSLPAIQKQVGHKANSAMTLDIYTKLSPEYIVEEHQKVESFYNTEEAKMNVRS